MPIFSLPCKRAQTNKSPANEHSNIVTGGLRVNMSIKLNLQSRENTHVTCTRISGSHITHTHTLSLYILYINLCRFALPFRPSSSSCKTSLQRKSFFFFPVRKNIIVHMCPILASNAFMFTVSDLDFSLLMGLIFPGKSKRIIGRKRRRS